MIRVNQLLLMLYGLAVLALFVVAFTVPKVRWVALTVAILATVVPLVLGAAFVILILLAFRNGAHIG